MVRSLPIKSITEINLIKDLYKRKKQTQNLLMFILAINTGLSLVELLNIKIKDIKGKHYLSFGKQKSVPLNNEILQLVEEITAHKKSSEFLFQNSQGKKLNRTLVFYNFKTHIEELGLKEKYSVSSWRKTFAYHYYQKYKDLAYLQWLFNQSSVEQALKYIGQDENMNLRYREGVSL